MADYLTKAAFIIPLSKEQSSFAIKVIECVNDHKIDFNAEPVSEAAYAYDKAVYELAKPLAMDLYDMDKEGLELRAEVRDEGLLFRHDDSIDSTIAAELTQQLLKHFDLDVAIPVEFSHYCSRANLDGFGGFAAIITKDEIKWFSTGDWVRQQMAQFDI